MLNVISLLTMPGLRDGTGERDPERASRPAGADRARRSGARPAQGTADRPGARVPPPRGLGPGVDGRARPRRGRRRPLPRRRGGGRRAGAAAFGGAGRAGRHRAERANAQRRGSSDRGDRQGGGRAGADRSRLQPRSDARPHRRRRRALRGGARQLARHRRARALGATARRRDRADDAQDERARARGPPGTRGRARAHRARPGGARDGRPGPAAAGALEGASGDDGADGSPPHARWTRSGGSRAHSRSAPAATRPRLRWTPRARRPNGSSPTREPQETTRVAVAALQCSRRPTPRRRRSAPPARRRRTSCSGAWPPSGTSWSPSSPPPCFHGRRSRVLVPMTKVQILGRQARSSA